MSYPGPDDEPKTEEFKSSFVDDDPVEFEPNTDEDGFPTAVEQQEQYDEYDEFGARAELNRMAKENADEEVNARYQAIVAKLNRIPSQPPSEEQFLQMTEQQKMLVSATWQERQRLMDELNNVLPNEHRRIYDSNQAKAEQIVNIQKNLQSTYPDTWIPILREVTDMARKGTIDASKLANPETYRIMNYVIMGRNLDDKATRAKFRSMAAGASLAGRGGTEGHDDIHQMPPRQLEAQLRRMQFSEGEIRSILRKNYPGSVR
jgi:hypothetical protein